MPGVLRSPVRPLVLLAAALGGGSGAAAQEPPQPAVSVRYRLEVSLHETPDGRPARIRGRCRAGWRNPTASPAAELRWHLYNNAWEGPDSLWLREARRRGDERLPRGWGRTEVERVQLCADWESPPGPDLAMSYVPQPDAPLDRTVLRVALPEEVAPGQEVVVELEFETLLPPAFVRNGTGGDFIHAAQWFPKLGVLEARDGAARWNCEPYRYLTEFYADFADFEVQLALPARFKGKVAATGSMLGPPQETPGGTVTYKFGAQRVHDFAWSADPDFLVFQRRFEPAAPLERAPWRDPAAEQRVAAALGRDAATLWLGPSGEPQATEALLFLQPEHASYAERYLAALERALYWYGLWYGPYPYETISLVDPAHAARATGGMEYPRLITGGVRLGRSPHSLEPEGVTVHEFGHQYWYGLVANDEVHHAWLDEGLNTYSTARALRQAFGPEPAAYEVMGRQFHGLGLASLPAFESGDVRALLALERLELPWLPAAWPDSFPLRRRGSLLDWLAELPPVTVLPEVWSDPLWDSRSAFSRDWSDALDRPTCDLLTQETRRVNAYHRPALMLATMERLMGEERWIRLLRAFQERWRYRHPLPEDFRAALEEFGAGASVGGVAVDWSAFWEQAYHGDEALDFGVHRLANVALLEEEDGAPRPAPRWEWVVEVRRYGGFRVPVEIWIQLDDGSLVREAWDGRDPWWRWRPAQDQARPARGDPRRVVQVIVDPERRLLLDRDWLNNTRRAEPDRGRARGLAWRVLLWAQLVLHAYGGLG